MQYGAFCLAAMQRILAARSQPKTPLDALADDHRTYLDRLLDENPTPPRPTSDYQALLGEEPSRWRTDPTPEQDESPERANRATADGDTPSLHDDVTAALRTLGRRVGPPMRSTRRCRRRRRNR